MVGFAASIFGKFYELARGRQRNKRALRTYKISCPKILSAQHHAAERLWRADSNGKKYKI